MKKFKFEYNKLLIPVRGEKKPRIITLTASLAMQF